jgi:hypothetical protein
VQLQAGQVAYAGDIIQTRRNDRDHDVENRQQWTISKISKDWKGAVVSARLVSVEDPGMIRTVDVDYLADHAHLSYAATVHGVQGETTDRALVGPGVDAAGLYVGLTRGRRHNAAILVADNTRDARTQLEETMRRGRIEPTLDDARDAAHLELSRAARTVHAPVSDDGAPAPWHDRDARPLGHLTRIDELLGAAVDQEKSLFEQISRLGDSIAVDQAALDELKVKLATWSATGHAAAVSDQDVEPAPLLLPATDAITARLQEARTRRTELSREYGKLTRRIDALQRENAIRDLLGADVTAYEDDARRRAVRERAATSIPAWDDKQRRPLGRVTALRAKHVATQNELTELARERDDRARAIAAAQQLVRTNAGPDGIPLTPEQRDRLIAAHERAQQSYDQVVEQHAKRTRLLAAIVRELELRDQLDQTSAATAARIESVRAQLEVGLNETGLTLSDQDRAELSTELAALTAREDQGAQEARDRHAARHHPDPASTVQTTPERTEGPALR